jgi:hypothetical protein
MALEEPVVLSSNRLDLEPRMPVRAKNIAKIYANGIEIPPEGLYSTALLKSAHGPFRIIQEEQDLLVAGSSEAVSFTLPWTQGKRLSVEDLRVILRRKLKTIECRIEGRQLVLEDAGSKEKNSTIQVSGRAAKVLFPHQQGTRGKQLYPGWDLYTPPNEITRRFFRFEKRLRNSPVFTVSYATFRTRCLRCGGMEVENDFRSSSVNGDILMVADENLLNQIVLKTLLTDIGSNPYFPSYGTSIRKRIGLKSTGTAKAAIRQDIQNSLGRVKDTQAKQSGYQVVSRKERLQEIVGVELRSPDNDPTTYLVQIYARNASAEPVMVTVTYTVSGVVARLVENGVPLSQMGSKGATFVTSVVSPQSKSKV